MNKLILTIISNVILQITVCGQTPTYILVPGIGFNDFKIGKTTFEDIISKMGPNYRLDTFYVKSTEYIYFDDSLNNNEKNIDIYSIGIFYDSLGISFYKYKNKKTIFSIYFVSPACVITDKGIKLNESTFNDLITLYGQTEWLYTKDKIFKEYNGIRFEQTCDYKFPVVTERNSNKIFSNKITGITITRKRKWKHSH